MKQMKYLLSISIVKLYPLISYGRNKVLLINIFSNFNIKTTLVNLIILHHHNCVNDSFRKAVDIPLKRCTMKLNNNF